METIPTDMSFGVSTADGRFEWGSYSLRSFISSVSLLFEAWFWRLMFDVLRFTLFAEDILYEDRAGSDGYQVEKSYSNASATNDKLESIAEYLSRQNYSQEFKTYFLIPMMAAPWCIDPDEFANAFPARPLIQFM